MLSPFENETRSLILETVLQLQNADPATQLLSLHATSSPFAETCNSSEEIAVLPLLHLN